MTFNPDVERVTEQAVNVIDVDKMPLALRLQIKRHGITFHQCIVESCIPELIENFDRLHETNIARKGHPINIVIEEACGKLDDDMKQFIEFVWEYIFLRFGE